jgi:hypothetical protein
VSNNRTKMQTLLIAAHALTKIGMRLMSDGDLAITAWGIDPEGFGIAGHDRRHPCTNKVRAMLVGQRGLVARGFLVKVAPLTYELTAKGIAAAAMLRLLDDHARLTALCQSLAEVT